MIRVELERLYPGALVTIRVDGVWVVKASSVDTSMAIRAAVARYRAHLQCDRDMRAATTDGKLPRLATG